MRPVSLYDLEAMAKQAMPHNLWDFVEGAAFDEITKHRNRTAFDEITINPSFLVDVNDRDASTTVLGERISFPVMVAPAGGQSQMHPDGELATALPPGTREPCTRFPRAPATASRRSPRSRAARCGSSCTTSAMRLRRFW